MTGARVTRHGRRCSLDVVHGSPADHHDLEDAYRRHGDRLIRHATAIVGPVRAGDAVADAMVKVLRRGGLHDVLDVEAYLVRAVHNAALDLISSASRREQRELRAHLLQVASPDQPADLDLLRALADLSPRQRAVMWLAYWEDLGVDAIAELLDISAGSVRQHLARARAAMRDAVEGAAS